MDAFYLLVLSILYITGTESANVTVFRYTSGILEQSADIRCSYSHLPGEVFANLEWQRGPTLTTPVYLPLAGTYIAGNGSLITTNYSRANLDFAANLVTRSSLVFTMRINHIGCDLEGDYRCVATFRDANNVEQRIVADTNFLVKEYPSPPAINVEPRDFLEFSDIVFQCQADVGRPQGKIKWNIFQKDQTAPIVKESTKSSTFSEGCLYFKMDELTIQATRDLVSVVCFVEHELMTSSDQFSDDSGPLQIVYRPSTPVIYKSPDRDSIKPGEDYVMSCTSDGAPEPTIRWYKNGIRIRTAGKYVIKNATYTDEALYECVASNTIETYETRANNSFMLKVLADDEVQVSVPECQTSDVTSSSYLMPVLVTNGIWVVVVIIAIVVYKCAPTQKNMKNSFSRLSTKFSVRRREDPTISFDRNYQGLSIKERRGRDSGTYASAIFEDNTYLDILSDNSNVKSKSSIRGRSSGVYDSSFVPKATPKRILPPQPTDNNYTYADDGYLETGPKY